jgi:membrane protein
VHAGFSGFVRFCASWTQDFLTRNSMQMAAAIAFYSFFSLFPLTLLIILGYGLIAGTGNVQDEALVRVVGVFIPVSQSEIIDTITGVALSWDWRAAGPLAFAGLVWASTAVFATVRKGINATWGIFTPRPFLRERVMDLTLTAAAGLLFMSLLYATTLVQGLQVRGSGFLGASWWQFLGGLAVTFLAFSFVYWFLPNRRVRYRDVLFGALLAALAFEVAKTFFFAYSARREVVDQVYGSLTSVAVLLGWLYVSAAIVLVGSLVCAVYVGLLRAGLARPMDVWTLGLAPIARRLLARRTA